jgi:hypothetical protein
MVIKFNNLEYNNLTITIDLMSFFNSFMARNINSQEILSYAFAKSSFKRINSYLECLAQSIVSRLITHYIVYILREKGCLVTSDHPHEYIELKMQL